MLSWIYYFVVSVVFLSANFYIGYRAGSRNKNTEKDTSVCSCDHPYSMHRESGQCNVQTTRHEYGGYKSYACPCVRYDGIPPAHVYMKDV